MLASWLRGTHRWRGAALGVMLLALAGAVGCGQQNTEGRSPSYLVVETLQAASGASPGTFSGVLESDVVTNVTVTVGGQQVASSTVYEDTGQVKLRMALKDVGNGAAVTAPTAANVVTVTRYHVDFKRADGRNTQGVDVPYSFDGAATGAIAGHARGPAEGAPQRRRRHRDLDDRRGHLLRQGPERQRCVGDRVHLGELRGLGRPFVVPEASVGSRPPGLARAALPG
jgi:hypothetical protein